MKLPSLANSAWIIIPVSITLINWSASWQGKRRWYAVSKPLVLASLILFFGSKGGFEGQGIPFAWGLGFSLLGDCLLIGQGQVWSAAGIAAFTAAHVAYMVGFSQWVAPVGATVGTTIVALGIYVLYLRWILAEADKMPQLKQLGYLFGGYFFFLIDMSASAVLCLFRSAWPGKAGLMAAAGGIAFVISDTILARRQLGRGGPHARFWTIASYHVAQFLIVAAVLSTLKN